MKKRFKKVVKWEKEPIFIHIYLGVFSFISLIVGFIGTIILFKNYNVVDDNITFMFLFPLGALLFIGLFLIAEGLGEGKKVLLEEVK